METGYTLKEGKYIGLLEDGFIPVETAPEVPIQEQYQSEFKNGSKIKINISIEFSSFNKNDLFEILQYFAQCSHNFYLMIAKKVNNKP